MKTASEIKNAIADDLKGFGGHLECSVCGYTQSLGNIGANLSEGWPQHHGYMMTWITARQEAEGVGSSAVTAEKCT